MPEQDFQRYHYSLIQQCKNNKTNFAPLFDKKVFFPAFKVDYGWGILLLKIDQQL
jgi:hypothetical protein